MTESTITPPDVGSQNEEDPETLKKKEFEERQDALRVAQNLPPGAVPEQRPQAFANPDPNAQHSQLYKDLDEAGELPGNEAMDFDAYKRAQSESQAKKAARSSKTPRLLDGARVLITKEGHENRPGVIIETNFKDGEAAAAARSGVPSVAMFAEVDSYVVRTRDSRTDQLTLKPDEVKPWGVEQGWSRGE